MLLPPPRDPPKLLPELDGPLNVERGAEVDVRGACERVPPKLLLRFTSKLPLVVGAVLTGPRETVVRVLLCLGACCPPKERLPPLREAWLPKVRVQSSWRPALAWMLPPRP